MKPSSSFYYYTFLLLLFISNMIGQEKNYTVRWYTSDNNELPQSSIKSIVGDKYNFIWMTTENGLVRYDGNNFIVFNSSTTELKECRFTDILGSVKKDSLYSYNDENKELVLINQRKIKLVPKRIQLHDIVKNGKRFFIHDGLPSTKTMYTDARYYVRLSNGNIYFISTEGVELCDAKMKTIYKTVFKNNSVFNFFTINDTLYYLKENGEYHCFLQNKKLKGKLDQALFKDKYKLYWNITSNQVFLCVKNELYLLSAKNNSLFALPIVNFKDFYKSNIVSVFYDRDNRKLYLGSNTNGLCIVSFPSFKAVKRKGINTDVYYAVVPFSDSSVITPDGLILNTEKVIDSMIFPKDKFFTERITMAKDANDDLWIAKESNVFCYLKKSGYKKYLIYSFGHQQIKTLFKDKNNTIWISLQQYESRKDKLYYISKPDNKLKLATTINTTINYITQCDSSTLYLGSKRGLFKYGIKSGRLTLIKGSQKLNIRSIFIDSGKKAWLTTYEKGFFLYSDSIIYTLPKDRNSYLNSSHCILEDKKGFFWIPTNKGLFQVSRQALLKYCSDKTNKGRIYYHYYNKEDGFLTNEFNGGCQPCGNYLKNGEIVFPSMNSLVFFNPDKIVPFVPGKEIFIDKVIVDHKFIYPKDTIVLDNNFHRIRFLIDYSYYGSLNNLNIEAKLNGTTNTNWEKIGDDKSISFTTLPPGEYTLVIRSLSGFNSVYTYKTIALIIPAMFYQTFWFKVFCCLLVVAFIIFLWYVRLYYIKLKNRQLKQVIVKKTHKLANTISELKLAKSNLKQEVEQQERLVKSISHDIKSPLKFLSFTVRHLFDKVEIQQDEDLKKEVESIYLSSVQLYEYVENLVKYSTIFIDGKKLEEQSYSLHELIEEKIQLFERIAYAENTLIVNSINKESYIKTNNKALSIIVHNLLDNAVKNTKNGTIELLSKIQGNMLFLTVKDNGTGMSKELIDYYHDFSKKPALKNYHQGLHMIIELLVILRGDIKIASKINEGTIIEVTMDCN